MQEYPKVTVITATYNLIKEGREKFFRQCVESVYKQTYSNIEHLIIDGNSIDGTQNILKEYVEKYGISYISEPDNGMWDAMNKGGNYATGEYLIYLNSDDYYFSDTIIEDCVKKIISTNADYVYGDTYTLDENTKKKQYNLSLPIECFWYHQPFNHEALMCKKSVFVSLGGYDVGYKTSIDYAFIIKLILNDCKHSYLPKGIIVSRPGGATVTKDLKFTQIVLDTVSQLYLDLYKSFSNYNREDYKTLFVTKNYSVDFINSLLAFLIKQNLSNFNYNYCQSFMAVFIEQQKNTSQKPKIEQEVLGIYFLNYFLPILKITKDNYKVKYKILNMFVLEKENKGETK